MTGSNLPAPRVSVTTAAQFLGCALIWGSTWLVIKDQLGTVPVAWSVAYRFIVAGAAMLVVCLVRRAPLRLGLAGHGLAALTATLQFAINFNFVYHAERYVTSGLVALIFALLVVPNTLLARLFLGTTIRWKFVAGSAIGLLGVALMVGRDLRVEGSATALGLGLAVAGMVCASAANVLQASARIRALPLEGFLTAALLYGGLVNAAYALASRGAPVIDLRPGYVLGVLYLGLIASALAFRLYYALIRAIGPGRAGYVNVVVPLVAMSLSTLFEGFIWTWSAAAGGLLALAGLVIALRSRA